MPVEVISPLADTGLVVTKFQKSVPMVTYLACFIVCDFQYTRTTTSAGKEFRVYSAPDQVNKTKYALQFGSRVLEYFENYFGIDYPLPKQDMVAIPDFVSGAMEHWGVITFRETSLLYDPKSSSPRNEQRVATVVSHEMAHMWFGNLVTMEWWDDLWLNEGFASYVEYKGVHEQHPEWDMLAQFVTEDEQPVMDRDSTMSSHPIVQPVIHPDEITEIFDDISYGKGASVLRMLEFFVGKENFRKGISQFLKKYQFKNAKTSQLWEELSEAYDPGNHTISSVMKTWTEQMGFPYISVKRIRQENETHTVFMAKQMRFVKNDDVYRQQMNASKDEFLWSVPLSYTTKEGESDIIWIHDAEKMEFTVPLKFEEWVKFNINQTGYYLVNYEEEDWNRLTEILISNHQLLSPSDRSNLLFDAFLLAEAGHIKFDVFFSMSMYLRNETHLIPWETAYASFVYLCELLEFTDTNFLLKNYVKDLTGDLYKKLGWATADNHLDNLLRTNIIGLSCHSGNQECLSDVSELFQNWTKGQEIPSTLRSLVYHYGMAEIGQEEHWNYMWNRFLKEESASERLKLLQGLAHVRVPQLIHRYLEYAMDDTKVRRQDFFSVLNFIAGNPIGRPLVWNFIKEKWPALVERFTLNDRYLGLAVKKVCSYFTSEYELLDMKSFFTRYPDAGAGKRRRQQALENVQNNIKWLKSYKEDVKLWLEIEGTAPWYHYRLPSYIVPRHYDLVVYPMLDEDRFNGSVKITVSLQKPSDYFLVHAVELNVSKVEVKKADDETVVALDDVFQVEENDYLVLKASEKLLDGMYELYFEFEGELTLSLKGLYKSSYVNPETKERRYLATTEFEAIDARRMFPCFDEPSFKATFNVTLYHDPSYIALSNTMVENTEILDNGLQATKFEKSLPMVTYLLCVIVCDYKYVETMTEKGVRLRVYTAPHHVEKTQYALSVASRILTYYANYFDVPFPLKKLDMITIPDYTHSGMENWGLITYSEQALLCDNFTTENTKYHVSTIIAHELAHMWFGDLVTMKWWDDLWLNEGFASYIAQKGVTHVDSSFDEVITYEATTALVAAMGSDQTINSHPIVQQVTRVKTDIFDSITYSKGAAILGMLEKYMGEDFRKGVSAYLKKYSYSTSRTEDLWAELTLSSSQGLNVTSLMNTWTKQMNYPYINVQRDKEVEGRFTVQQHRFLKDPRTTIFSTNQSPFNYVWHIPLTYRTAENPEPAYTLLASPEKVNLNLPKSEWIKFNANFSGYYSINYDEEDWRKFGELLLKDHTIFSPTDRINLLFDAFALASAGLLDYSVPLNLTRYLKKETDFGAWTLAITELTEIRDLLKNDRMTREIVKEYIRSLAKDLYQEHSWNFTGSYSQRMFNHIIIGATCGNKHQECLIQAATLFRKWMKGAELSPDMRSPVYAYGLRTLKSEDAFNYVLEKYIEEDDPSEKSNLINALCEARNATLLERLIRLARNESIFRKHEYFIVLRNVASNERGLPLVTQVIFNNWTELTGYYIEEKVEKFAYSVFSLYETEKDLEKVREFYKKNKNSKFGQKYRTLAIENILENIRWHQMHSRNIKNWFQTQVFMPWKNKRLPRHILPQSYNLKLNPNMAQSTFDGQVDVVVDVTEETSYMLVHSVGLKIGSTEVKDLEMKSDVAIDETFPFRMNSFWVIRFAKLIPPGSYFLRLNFSGDFAVDGHGMGRYRYTNKETQEKRYLIATKFEPTDARRVFPCFDEPAMKAIFKLTIVHDKDYNAVSNMPQQSKRILNDSVAETNFHESVKMSTYLLCCVVSDFAFLEQEYKGKKVRAYAPPDCINEAEHGLNTTINILAKYEEFFDIDYVLPKLDSIAVPEYTVPGMEHWGIITYNTRNFLVDENLSTYKRMADVDRVIAHELAHQWFGNLVTMKWWNDLWLNEGLSTLIMYIPLNHYYSSANELDVRKVSKMMCADSSLDSHPILRVVPADISNLFDSISYEKGGAVLKMLQYTLKDDFRKGLSNYLKKYAFKNAETKDLWEELSNASRMDVNITEMMNTWTLQMGFPYVELQREGSKLTATQHWFLRKYSDSSIEEIAQNKSLSPFGFVWQIPLVYKNLATGNEYTIWLKEKTATFEINALKDDALKFNPNFVGFYVVKYDDSDWEKLYHKMRENHEDLSVTDRYNLLHDAFILAETNRIIYDIPLELTKYLKQEKELLPWSLFRDQFIHFLRRIDGKSITAELLKKYVAELTKNLYDEYVSNMKNNSYFKTWETSAGSCSYTFPDLDFISTIVDLSCQALNQKCIDAMNEELQLWTQGKKISSDLSFVFKTAIPHYGNSTLWNVMTERIIDPDVEDSEKLDLAVGLASFRDSILYKSTINFMMLKPEVNTELARAIFQGLGSNPEAVPTLWDYTKRNWKSLLLRLDAKSSPTIGISIFCETFKTTKYLGEFITFLKQVPQINEYVMEGCLEDIQNSVEWSEKYEETLLSWLRWNAT
ncbi:uncharacterized protein LOC129216302 [Uloborus diversus]|uniref:uncharacterized protein LOC129216302 n=1 Tax=Uloborus diversus TaxID=327109 RepID=UPI00240A6945|nr:uncharacterized protein LOC129216302 [Uloborus diversus]